MIKPQQSQHDENIDKVVEHRGRDTDDKDQGEPGDGDGDGTLSFCGGGGRVRFPHVEHHKEKTGDGEDTRDE